MAVELSALSFVCAVLLFAFIPVRRVRMSIPHLAIIFWLGVYHLIHGINAIVWDGNVDIRIPVWCDIVTKFMLGTKVALPAAFSCIARELELASSSRTYSSDKKAVQIRRMFEFFLCYLVPVVYIVLHVVIQDHRFDLAQDYGCQASVYPSLPSVSLLWIPPFIFCSITFILSGFAQHNSSRTSYPQFVVDIESRSDMTSSIFSRRLSTCFIMAAALLVLCAFSIFLSPAAKPWTSWDSVHSHIWEINIVNSEDKLKVIHLEWWAIFAVSAVYIFLSFAIGEECRDAFKWIIKQLTKQRRVPEVSKHHLPLFSSKPTESQMVEVPKRPASRPATLDLRSGWDDMLDVKSARWTLSSRRSQPSPSPSCASPTPSGEGSPTEEDKAFMASTLSYLGSPTAKTLGISSSPQSETPLYLASQALEIPPKPLSPPPPVPIQRSSSVKLKHAPRPDTPPDQVLGNPWPALAKPSNQLAPAKTRARSASRSCSPSSFTNGRTVGYPLHPTVTPPHLHKRPFENSSISSVSSASPPTSPTTTTTTTTTQKPLKSALKRPSLTNMRRSWSKDQLRHLTPEVIHMTVVQETETV